MLLMRYSVLKKDYLGGKKSHIRKMILEHQHRNKILESGALEGWGLIVQLLFFFWDCGRETVVATLLRVQLFPSSISLIKSLKSTGPADWPLGGITYHQPPFWLRVCSRPLTTSLMLVWSLIFLFFTHKLLAWSWLIVRGNWTQTINFLT